MKKVLFLAFLIVESWLPVSAQFGGFSQNGNFQLFRIYLSPWDHYNLSLGVSKSEEYNNPVYIPGAKSVIKRRQQIYYDRTEDSWHYGRQVESYKIYFDSVGRVVKSCRLVHEYDEVKEKDYYIFSYIDSRLKRIIKKDILNEYPIFSFHYDSAGVLKRAINDNNEWHVSVQFNDSTIYVREFVNGDETKSSPLAFKISQNGKALSYSNEYTNDSIQWIRDEHGYTTMYCSYDKYNTKPDIIYFENNYDKDGNIRERFEYEMKDIGKWYKGGFIFDYEYDFGK